MKRSLNTRTLNAAFTNYINVADSLIYIFCNIQKAINDIVEINNCKKSDLANIHVTKFKKSYDVTNIRHLSNYNNFFANSSFDKSNSILYKNEYNEFFNAIDYFYEKILNDCEAVGNFSNGYIFRDYRSRDGRLINTINSEIKGEERRIIESLFNGFNSEIIGIYNSLFLNRSTELSESVIGFIPGKSYVDHARKHLGCESLITIDISKFFESIDFSLVLRNNCILNVLKSSFYVWTGHQIDDLRGRSKYRYDMFMSLFGFINVIFIGLFNFFMHNGKIPTGAKYSPAVSNLILAPVDVSIIDTIDKDVCYSRYVDDISISCKNGLSENGYSIDIDTVKKIEEIVNNNGFYLKYSKTTISGKPDKKVICGIILADTPSGQFLSIGTKKKLQLRNLFEGRSWNDLDQKEKGTIEWVRSVNFNQYSFIIDGINNVPESKKVELVSLKIDKKSSKYIVKEGLAGKRYNKMFREKKLYNERYEYNEYDTEDIPF